MKPDEVCSLSRVRMVFLFTALRLNGSVTTLDMISKKQPKVKVKIVTSPRGNMLTASDIKNFNAQYPAVAAKTNMAFHDHFLIFDNQELYLIGASLKDLDKNLILRLKNICYHSFQTS